jgi:hypothetical protein
LKKVSLKGRNAFVEAQKESLIKGFEQKIRDPAILWFDIPLRMKATAEGCHYTTEPAGSP